MYFIMAVATARRRWRLLTGFRPVQILLDMCTPVLQFATLLWLYIVDKAPPDPFAELLKAFKDNSEDEYFRAMGIM